MGLRHLVLNWLYPRTISLFSYFFLSHTNTPPHTHTLTTTHIHTHAHTRLFWTSDIASCWQSWTRCQKFSGVRSAVIVYGRLSGELTLENTWQFIPLEILDAHAQIWAVLQASVRRYIYVSICVAVYLSIQQIRAVLQASAHRCIYASICVAVYLSIQRIWAVSKASAHRCIYVPMYLCIYLCSCLSNRYGRYCRQVLIVVSVYLSV